LTLDFQFDGQRHEFKKDGVVIPSVTQVIARAGLCDYSFIEEERRAYYLQRGRSVHWLLQLDDEGALNYRKVPRALLPYRRAYKDWRQNSGFVPQLIEQKFVSKYGFAGIIDRVGLFPVTFMYHSRTRCVLDFKTGATQPWVALQLAAYTLAIEPNVALARTIRRIGLSLLGDGTYKVTEFKPSEFDNDISKFMEALNAGN
jgi:hypothetical protein